jgi:hypothetical protein
LGHENEPTAEELKTLRRVPDKIPWKVYTIAFVELSERLSFYGTTQVSTCLSRLLTPLVARRPARAPGASQRHRFLIIRLRSDRANLRNRSS